MPVIFVAEGRDDGGREMKVYIIRNNVNYWGAGGGYLLGGQGSPDSPDYFLFFYFLLRFIVLKGSCVQLLCNFFRENAT